MGKKATGERKNICIIGGGAAGMAVAIEAAKSNPFAVITILEKRPKLGSKVLATGNGRCNITNSGCPGYVRTAAFFESIGVFMRQEGQGRMYPATGQARDVVAALEQQVRAWGVAVHTGCTVTSISADLLSQFERTISGETKDLISDSKTNIFTTAKGLISDSKTNISAATEDRLSKEKFEVVYTDEGGAEQSLTADCVIVTTGGKAAPVYGTTGDGYSFAKTFGHTVERLYPVLTTLRPSDYCKELKGLRARADLKLERRQNSKTRANLASKTDTEGPCRRIGGAALGNEGGLDGADAENTDMNGGFECLAVESGELQFTEKGISGIAVMNLSRFVDTGAGYEFSDYRVIADFVPEFSVEELLRILCERQKIKGLVAGTALNTIVDRRISENILKKLGISAGAAFITLEEEKIKKIAEMIKAYPFIISGAGGWKEAQCTKGGISLGEINEDTMESKLCQGLFFAGEILDYDGPCGGYNLQNAWETGIKAGQGASN